MRIGIITFHWGTNYGGVLQAFALQEYLKKMGHEVSIINYFPKSQSESFIRSVISKSLRNSFNNAKTFFKEKRFVPFRVENLTLTRRYYSLEDLQKHPPEMDVYISGSDQVWNPYILDTYGIPYYLGFGDQTVKRISYAVSLGCIDYPKEKMDLIRSFLKDFDALSVRENTGITILQHVDVKEVALMPDPTLLLGEADLAKFIRPLQKKVGAFAFFYILQEDQNCINDIYKFVTGKLRLHVVNTKHFKHATMSIEEWLSNIANSMFVVTNSFHGVVFSLLLKRNFLVVPVEGRHAGMNDRIETLLTKFGLEDKIVREYNEANLVRQLNIAIDWVKIGRINDELKSLAHAFFKKNLSE
ncbi:polysaccharide pyruvyl transferase family protein [Pedobacter sp.]|uniref:polysaccharide pyruvyl transferase family protein n=1 Tax=Pedobacter sp. TaxID=1411316 RepID=UPI003D7F9CCC